MKLTDRVRAALALDGDADPQARDDKYDPWGTTIDVDREEPSRGDIEDWSEEYEENPLIRVPTQTFTSDILEPGVRVDLGIGEDDDMPTVSGYYDDDYNGLDLDDALEKWLTEAGIVDGEFDHDIRDVLEKALKDLIGRRGTSMVEVVYDDRTEQNRIMGLRPFKVETTTAYTREGKAILLRPDDGQEDADFDGGFEPKSVQSLGDGERSSLPQTSGGETACYIQFDDSYGSWDSKEVRFSQTDVVKHANDADTAEIFGTPYTASVYDRAHAVRQQYKDLDQAMKAVSYSHFVAKVDTDDEDQAKKLLQGFDPSSPEKVNVVSYNVDVDQYTGDVPDVNDTLKQEIEYVLSAFPVPIYRIGFEGEINRDVTGEQSDDYQRELSDWRNELAQKFQGVIQRKAQEFAGEDAPSVELVIAERESANPLDDESFDAEAFATTMQGVKAATGPGESPTDILPAETILETFLGLDPDEVLGDDGEAADLGALDEADPLVRDTFVDVYGADLAALTESDPVTTPDGRGVIVDVHEDEFDFQGDTYQPEDGTLYVVATEAGADVYERSELEEEDWTEDVDTGSPEDLQEAALADSYAALSTPPSDPESVEALLDTGFDSWPDSWREADIPARLIALDAWTSMEASFRGCMTEIGDAEVCAAFKDEMLQWTGWR